jgi:energy-converting hydrogenase Eha subunit G
MSTITPPSGKGIANTLYHGAVVGGLSVGYSMISKRLLKIKPADLGRLDVEDAVKVTTTVAAALATRDMLVQQGILPADILK